jgi:hypothetical protein
VLERTEYNNILKIFHSKRTYEWEEFCDMLDRMWKPFSCNIEGRNVRVTEADAAIMMEKSALDEISKILVSNKRIAGASDNAPAKKRRRNNAACNTTRGATGFDALHGSARRDHRENSKLQESQIKTFQREKESFQRLLSAVAQWKEECRAAYVAAVAKARKARRNKEGTPNTNVVGEGANVVSHVSSEVGEGANVTSILAEGVGRGVNVSSIMSEVDADSAGEQADDEEMNEILSNRRRREEMNVSVTEYWQVLGNSTSTTMDLFLRLFVPKSGVLQKNKHIKWKTLQEKVIKLGVLTKTQFDS